MCKKNEIYFIITDHHSIINDVIMLNRILINDHRMVKTRIIIIINIKLKQLERTLKIATTDSIADINLINTDKIKEAARNFLKMKNFKEENKISENIKKIIQKQNQADHDRR